MVLKLSVRNFPRNTKIVEVKKFFTGVKISFAKLNNHGVGWLEVKNEKNANEALKKNSCEFKNHLISVRLLNENESIDTKSMKTHEKKQKFPAIQEKDLIDKISDTGRLYLRNLNYDVTEADIVEMFKGYGDLIEVHLPYDLNFKKIKGFGYVTFMMPDEAVKAFKALDKAVLKGRKIHILPGEEKPEGQKCKGVLEGREDEEEKEKIFKEAKMDELKSGASSGHNWNALFVNSDVVAQYLADQLQMSKSDLFSDALKGSISVKLAQAETRLVMLIKQFMLDNHIRLDTLEKITNRGPKSKGNVNVSFSLSSTTFMVKNLSPGVTEEDLKTVFNQYPGLERILLPPYGVTAIVSYKLSQQAKVAYQNCAYMEFQDSVMMLQWAPVDIFQDVETDNKLSDNNSLKKDVDISVEPITKADKKKRRREQERIEKENEEKKLKLEKDTEEFNKRKNILEEELVKKTSKIIVKNIPFQSTQKELEELFSPFKGIIEVRLPKKSSGGHKGFAFIEFESEDQAKVLMDSMSDSTHLLGRRLILQYSETA